VKKFLKSVPGAVLLAVFFSACGGGGGDGPVAGEAAGGASANTANVTATLATLSVEPLSVAEQESLAYMREEEKLAHDVYIQLDSLWRANTRVFGNIANSEASHTELLRQLLLRYSQPDPAASTTVGIFQNTKLQSMYQQLVAAGSVSLVEALKVGAAIEEIDMIDINAALLSVDNQDINLVYQNLLKGSRNHLRSFVGNLTNQGVSYVPQYMSVADYQAIVSTPMEH
jgi:hypothetical protein